MGRRGGRGLTERITLTDVRHRLASSAIFYRHKHAAAKVTRQGAAYGRDEYNRAVLDEAWYSGAYFATRQAQSSENHDGHLPVL